MKMEIENEEVYNLLDKTLRNTKLCKKFYNQIKNENDSSKILMKDPAPIEVIDDVYEGGTEISEQEERKCCEI